MDHQANYHHHHVKVIEHFGISPPQGSISLTTIPLTFFDIATLVCVPAQLIFFYDFPHNTDHFLRMVLPNLKHSLSLTLQHFFPFAANLVFPPKPQIPFLLCSESDSVSFIIAESTQDFHQLISDTPKDVRISHPLVPIFPPTRVSKDGTVVFPLMAIQVTIVPNSGLSICVTFRHVVADGSAFFHFMRFWSYLCRTKGYLDSIGGSVIMPDLPLHDKDLIKDPKGCKLIYLQQLWNSPTNIMELNHTSRDDALGGDNNKVHITCVFRRDQVEKLKKWVRIKCKNHGLDLRSLHISTFEVICSLIWVCMVKSEVMTNVNIVRNNDDEICHWTIVGDCRNLPQLFIPSNYFGNCLIVQSVSLNRSKLLGEYGLVEAMLAIKGQIKDFQCQPLKGVETMISNFVELAQSGQNQVSIAGSVKLGAYDVDFGWGKTKKFEIPHIEYSKSISLCECRDNDGGVEVGVVLESIQMNNFNAILKDLLRNVYLEKSNL